MKKIFCLLIVFISIITLNGCVLSNYTIKCDDLKLNQYNSFDPYEIEAYDKEKNDLIDNVVIYGLELLNIIDGRITEFGSFSLRYTIVIDEEVVCQTYRNIVVTYFKDTSGLIYNTDFLAGLNDWGIIDWKSSLDVCVEDYKLKIVQNSVDENIWDQSLYQYVNYENNLLEVGSSYKISFDASSTYNKTIKICLAQVLNDTPWSYNVMNEYDVEINSSMSTYEIDFTCINPSNIVFDFAFDISSVRIEFKFGNYNGLNNQSSTIYFDNIKLIKNT